MATALRAIVFDLDGTLVDSLDDIAGALARTLADLELPIPDRATVREWIGGGARNLIERAVPDPARIDAGLARFRMHYRAAPAAHTRLYAGLDEILDALVDAGRTLAILSNKPHDLTVDIAEHLLERWPFAVIAGQRPGVPLKPHPEAALIVAAELGVPPEACALVGDGASDIETAHAAGMMAVAVSWGFRPRAELVAAHPALIADRPADLAVLAR